MVRELAGATSAEARNRATELLDYLGVGHRKSAMPATISGGEAQRVAIARAIANRPRIVLADEPTAALDSQRAGIVMDLMSQVATEQKAAIIVVSHDEKIFNRFHRIFHLRDGQLEHIQSNGASASS
jgi:putative ABC transport system ATP-binding protein